MVRIGGGKFKGRIIKTPNTKMTRVSTSYFKKVIFDTLAPYIEDTIVLDLFAGSGSLGIEAISRGAKKAYFVDKEAKPIIAIKENIDLLAIKDRCSAMKMDAFKYLNKTSEPVDILFLDPPYGIHIDDLKAILSIFDDRDYLNESGIICLEIKSAYADELGQITFENFSLFKEKRKGGTTLLFYK